MAERLNLAVEEGIGDLLTELAGGERKRGQYLSDLVRGMRNQTEVAAGSDFEALRLSHAGLVGQVRQNEGRLLILETRVQAIEQQLAAIIADRQ